MRSRHFRLALTMLLLSRAVGAQDVCSESRLPPELAKLLQAEYTGWQIVNLQSMGKENRDAWNQNHQNECPGIAIGGFRGDQDSVYAILLRKEGVQKHLLLISDHGRRGYEFRVLDREAGDVISRQPPGTYESSDQALKMITKTDSLLSEYMWRGGDRLFFWQGAHFCSIQTDD
jgi:hypothetical protein